VRKIRAHVTNPIIAGSQNHRLVADCNRDSVFDFSTIPPHGPGGTIDE
jgi:hypothetical protein